MTLCLLALPLTSEATPHACQKQHTQQHKQAKSCHKEDVPECCKEKQGAAPKHTCCQVAPMSSYARLEKTELEHTLKLFQKQVIPTIIDRNYFYEGETAFLFFFSTADKEHTDSFSAISLLAFLTDFIFQESYSLPIMVEGRLLHLVKTLSMVSLCVFSKKNTFEIL